MAWLGYQMPPSANGVAGTTGWHIKPSVSRWATVRQLFGGAGAAARTAAGKPATPPPLTWVSDFGA